MQHSMRVVPLENMDEKRLLDFLEKDRVLHIFTIYDLTRRRDKTKVYVALRNEQISGYLFEYDKRIVHIHGDRETASKLILLISLDEPIFVIYPSHLRLVNKFFEPIKPADSATKGKITTFLVMKASAESFKSVIKHKVKKLEKSDLDEVSRNLGDEVIKTIEEALTGGLAFGAYENGALSSTAAVPELLDKHGLIRGVYTAPELRSRGLATSACSALVEELLRLGREPVLWVSKVNPPARKLYEKIGFKQTGVTVLSFKAERRSPKPQNDK
jgi:GNAT superfamily N-acetyltransferase